MHPSVRAVFRPISESCEDLMQVVHLDMHRDRQSKLDPLVATTIGNLIGLVASVRAVEACDPWSRRLSRSGCLARAEEVAADLLGRRPDRQG